DDYNQHYDRADAARQLCNQQIKKAKECWQEMPEETRANILSNLSAFDICKDQKPCTGNICMHYSFDFAQQVVCPYSNQQRGKEYFKTARKCQIFGICAEALSRQVFFLIDESESSGKGSRTVISLLDAYFRLHGIGEEEASLHADNCTGQNKNNYVIWYLMWRVMNGLHKRITLSFMIPGHTKFAPDRYFGLFKIKYRRSTIDCLHDLVMCVNNCSSEQTVAQVYGRHLGLKRNAFEYSKWDEYLSSYFKSPDGILKYNCFSFDHEEPGVVRFSVNPDDKPDSVNIFTDFNYHCSILRQ
ncbi:MAG: hypothetical protein GY749_00550, partial [Desulfobacteraceae bacterium]|nr:hypothetical protein [Desulfobacteraceae bacterium]